MKIHKWAEIRRGEKAAEELKDFKESLHEIAEAMKTASPTEKNVLSKKIDKLLGTKVEEPSEEEILEDDKRVWDDFEEDEDEDFENEEE